MTKPVNNPPPALDEDAKLDEALEETFPASDPVAITPSTIRPSGRGAGFRRAEGRETSAAAGAKG